MSFHPRSWDLVNGQLAALSLSFDFRSDALIQPGHYQLSSISLGSRLASMVNCRP